MTINILSPIRSQPVCKTGRLNIPAFFFCILVTGFLICCNGVPEDEKIKKAAGEIVRSVSSDYIGDDRINIFEVNQEIAGQQLLVRGQTDLPAAKYELLRRLDSAGIKFLDSLIVLPSEKAASAKYALVNLSVANLRKAPLHSSELVSQVLLGTPLKILSAGNGWYRVRCPDKYIGWIGDEEIVPIPENQFNKYRESEKIIFKDLSGTLYGDHAIGSPPVTDLVAGDIMLMTGSAEGFYRVSLPDGREGFVRTASSEPYRNFIGETNAELNELVNTGRSMLGIPYLWGGTSAKGMDCSGFVKTVYMLNGINLPRDADQQIVAGESVDNRRNFNELQPGDLLFFGRKEAGNNDAVITHVGMWIGGMRYIHASGRVKINSMDSLSEDFGRYNYNRYVKSMRVVGIVSRNEFLDPDLILY